MKIQRYQVILVKRNFQKLLKSKPVKKITKYYAIAVNNIIVTIAFSINVFSDDEKQNSFQ